MTPLGALLTERRHILLDFDGPVCAVFSGLSDHVAADRLRAIVGADVPAEVSHARDPFTVVRYAATLDPATAARVEHEFQLQELEAVRTAQPTPGAAEAIHALRRSGHSVIIVSNNSTRAVRTYLDSHGLSHSVEGVSARTNADVAHLKPEPFLLHQAMKQHHASPDQCVMIGDSATDIEAANTAGVASIAYANKPSKRDRFTPLRPAAIIDHMREISAILAVS